MLGKVIFVLFCVGTFALAIKGIDLSSELLHLANLDIDELKEKIEKQNEEINKLKEIIYNNTEDSVVEAEEIRSCYNCGFYNKDAFKCEEFKTSVKNDIGEKCVSYKHEK